MEDDASSEDDERYRTYQQTHMKTSKRSLIWRVGKKIMITGVVISSAPFVLPPLIVASGIGFALSVPFGLVFASYACTEKVMSVLLPPPYVTRVWEDVEDDYGVEEDGVGLERTDDTEVDDKVEECPQLEEIMEGVDVEEMVENREMVVGVEGAARQRKEGILMVEEGMPVVEEREVKTILMVEEGVPVVEEREVKTILIREGSDGETLETQSVSLEVSYAKEEHSSSVVVMEKVDTVRVEEISSSSNEVPYNEEQIRELINSMRKVVGYKGDMQPTFSEELKDLFIFTGVDPPVTFKDPLDLVEISDKLRLLMTVVGVK